MGMSYFNPYWSKAIQNQQKAQPKPQAKPQQQPKQQEGKQARSGDHGGFDSLIVGRESVIKLGTGEAIKGTISAASKFWYLVTAGNQVMIINKAYVVMVMPIQTPQNNTNTAGDGNAREQSSKQQ
jgi:hypothetical protein